MRRLVLAFALVVLALPARAGPADEIAAVISAQIKAFRADDMSAAYRFASPGIQARFRDPAGFGEMVRGGYPMIHRAQRFEMGELKTTPAGRVQTVLIEGPAGRLYEAEYRMVRHDGSWRIAGVKLRLLPQLAS